MRESSDSAGPFAAILAEIEGVCSGFETAVFFDELGETVDLFTRGDPFAAKLVAAYHVVLFLSARARMAWIGAGDVSHLEIFAARRESVTVKVQDGYFVTALVRTGGCDDALMSKLEEVAVALAAEAGF